MECPDEDLGLRTGHSAVGFPLDQLLERIGDLAVPLSR
jgi:hypothetical protein